MKKEEQEIKDLKNELNTFDRNHKKLYYDFMIIKNISDSMDVKSYSNAINNLLLTFVYCFIIGLIKIVELNINNKENTNTFNCFLTQEQIETTNKILRCYPFLIRTIYPCLKQILPNEYYKYMNNNILRIIDSTTFDNAHTTNHVFTQYVDTDLFNAEINTTILERIKFKFPLLSSYKTLEDV